MIDMDYEVIKNAMAELEEDELLEAVKAAATDSDAAQQAVAAMQEGMQEVGSRFEEGDYFVADLIYAGEIMTGAMDILKPLLGAGGGDNKAGRMILCTVKDDMHDIGKNIVRAMLEAGGFEVLDLGIDVAPETVVDTAKKENIKIIALSGVLTLSLDSMKAVVEAFKAAGMRDEVKIIIGGAPVSPEACSACGADEWAHSPQKTVDVCRSWL